MLSRMIWAMISTSRNRVMGLRRLGSTLFCCLMEGFRPLHTVWLLTLALWLRWPTLVVMEESCWRVKLENRLADQEMTYNNIYFLIFKIFTTMMLYRSRDYNIYFSISKIFTTITICVV